MGGVPKNGEGTERFHTWGSETDYREAAAEREGWEMVLPLTGVSHEGSGAHRRQNVNKQKAERSRTVYCYATAFGNLRGGKGGAWVTMWCWEQKGIDWYKAKARGAETESESKAET